MKGRIAIACGGSGGHIFPALAVAEKLVQQGHEVRLYISAKKVDQDILAAYPQYQVATIPGLGWTGFNLSAIRVFKKLFDAYRVCLKETRTFKPHVVLSMGSFTGAPLLMAAISEADSFWYSGPFSNCS
jgi:UDP-N-acetylglucosamine--N-acetylmuramyl-(pentapeptide) pyrophosphoryl-undecaprenol N-acetylglucosamine transferase